jgi:GNAT superfamily N-acetyltransferase
MTIRPARSDETREIAQVHVRSWQHAYRGLLPEAFLAGLDVEARAAMWAEAIATGAPRLLVAEVSAAIAGLSAFGACRDAGADAAERELWALYVAPEHWGTGVGRSLWLASREAMAAEGARAVRVWALDGNARALRFYAAAGLHPDGMRRPFELAGAGHQATATPATFLRLAGPVCCDWPSP